MDMKGWDERYGAEGLVWSASPNQFLVAEAAGLAPGRALDVACGEGRNAIWLASRGWRVSAVDFSAVGLEKARRLASARGISVDWSEADVTNWSPAPAAFDLVIILYLQLPAAVRRDVYHRMAAGVAGGGTILVVGHDSRNLSEGYGGPQDGSVLFSPEDVEADLDGLQLQIVKAEQVGRSVNTEDGERTALDALVRAVRA